MKMEMYGMICIQTIYNDNFFLKNNTGKIYNEYGLFRQWISLGCILPSHIPMIY